MKFNLTQKEIEHIIGQFIQDKGLNPGSGYPSVELVAPKKGEIEASIDVAIDITSAMGTAAAMTQLSNKPKADLSKFTQEEPEPEATPKEEPKPKPRKKPGPKPKKQAPPIEEEEVVEEQAPLVEEEESVVEEETAPAGDGGKSLFGSSEAADTSGSIFGADSTPGVEVEPEEETDDLGKDTLFAPVK